MQTSYSPATLTILMTADPGANRIDSRPTNALRNLFDWKSRLSSLYSIPDLILTDLTKPIPQFQSCHPLLSLLLLIINDSFTFVL
jgi:hypothetical protein